MYVCIYIYIHILYILWINDMHVCGYLYILGSVLHGCIEIERHRDTDAQMHRYTDTQIHRCTGT